MEVGKRYSCVTLAKGAVSAGADKVGIFSLVGGLCRRRRLSIACERRDGGGVGLRREAAHPPSLLNHSFEFIANEPGWKKDCFFSLGHGWALKTTTDHVVSFDTIQSKIHNAYNLGSPNIT